MKTDLIFTIKLGGGAKPGESILGPGIFTQNTTIPETFINNSFLTINDHHWEVVHFFMMLMYFMGLIVRSYQFKLYRVIHASQNRTRKSIVRLEVIMKFSFILSNCFVGNGRPLSNSENRATVKIFSILHVPIYTLNAFLYHLYSLH